MLICLYHVCWPNQSRQHLSFDVALCLMAWSSFLLFVHKISTRILWTIVHCMWTLLWNTGNLFLWSWYLLCKLLLHSSPEPVLATHSHYFTSRPIFFLLPHRIFNYFCGWIIFHCMYTVFSWSIYLMIATLADSTSWLMFIVLRQTWWNKYLFDTAISYLLGIFLAVELLDCMVILFVVS